MDESFPKLMTNNEPQVQEALRRPGRVDIKMYNQAYHIPANHR